MSHTNKFIRLSAKSFILSVGLTLVACGGGGGSSSPAGIEYTGNTSPAAVDNTNTQTYSAAIMDGSQDSQENLSNFGGLSAIATDSSSNQNKQHAMLSALVQQVKTDIENNSFGGSNLISGATETFPGNCLGKEGSFTVTSDQTSNGINASVNYNNYCTDFAGITTTLSGSLTAVIVLSGNSITSMNVTVPRITISITNNTETYTNEFSGSVAVTFTAGGSIATMEVSMNFVENGKVYKLSGLSYTTSGSDISISGTIYHPDHGYVTFTTTEPFALYNEQLCDGTLAVTGVNSNFTITANATCESYTYSGTNNTGVDFIGNFTTL